MPAVNENESTAKSASQGVGVDMIANPVSGISFPEAVVLQQTTIQGVTSVTASASFTQNVTVTGASGGATGLTVNNASIVIVGTSGAAQGIVASGVTITPKSGVNFFTFQSGGALGGSGASFSGILPQGYINVLISGVEARIPFFN